MISYYKSKHPGLFLYLTLVIISVITPLYIELTTAQTGILSILWGGFIFMRTLSLYEISEHFSHKTSSSIISKNNHNSALPYDLTSRMSGQNNFKRGIFAMRSMHIKTLCWFAIGLIYMAYSFYLSRGTMPHSLILQNLSILFMIGAGFWAGQTYAYSDHASKLLILVFTCLLSITIFKMSGSLIIENFEIFTIDGLTSINNNAMPILLALIAYSAAILCYSAMRDLTSSINAALGLTIILLLTICGLSLEPSPQTLSLWLSGWSLLSIFWVRSSRHTEKSYAIYQCQ